MSREFLAVIAVGSAALCLSGGGADSKNEQTGCGRMCACRTDRFTVLALLCAVTEAVHPSIAPSYATAWLALWSADKNLYMKTRPSQRVYMKNWPSQRVYMKIWPSQRVYMRFWPSHSISSIRHTEPYIQCEYHDNGLEEILALSQYILYQTYRALYTVWIPWQRSRNHLYKSWWQKYHAWYQTTADKEYVLPKMVEV